MPPGGPERRRYSYTSPPESLSEPVWFDKFSILDLSVLSYLATPGRCRWYSLCQGNRTNILHYYNQHIAYNIVLTGQIRILRKCWIIPCTSVLDTTEPYPISF